MQWIDNFFKDKANQIMAKVSHKFLITKLNDQNFQSKIANFEDGKSCILTHGERGSESSAIDVYGRIHALYLLTPDGYHQMLTKFNEKVFLKCPRIQCNDSICFPIGINEAPMVKMYCPKCKEIYNCESNLSGSFFGSQYIQILVKEHPELEYKECSNQQYVPRIFGFKIYSQPENLGSLNKENEEEPENISKKPPFPPK